MVSYFVFPGLPEPAKVSADRVAWLVYELTGVTRDQIQGRRRNKEIIFARSLLAYLLVTRLHLNKVKATTYIYGKRPARDNRQSLDNLLRVHNSMVSTNPIYSNITKQAHVLYDRSTSRPAVKP